MFVPINLSVEQNSTKGILIPKVGNMSGVYLIGCGEIGQAKKIKHWQGQDSKSNLRSNCGCAGNGNNWHRWGESVCP